MESTKITFASDVLKAEDAVVSADPTPRVADTFKVETCVSEEVHVKVERFAALNNLVYCGIFDAFTTTFESNR